MNPGFEPIIDRAIVIVQNTNSTGFSDNNAVLARPDGFWNGATFQVRTGASAGISGTITSSTAVGSDGLPWLMTSGPPPTLATGDAVSVTQTQTSGGPYSWFWPPTSDGYVEINTTDQRPGSPGHSVAELTLQGTVPTEIDYYWDELANTIPGGKFLPVNGAWQLSFWARATVGAPTLTTTFVRVGAMPFVSNIQMLGNTWQQYSINFTGSDTGPANPMMLSFVAKGQSGAVRLDDVQLGRVIDSASAWRTEVVQGLQTLHPGYLRDLQLQLGDTMNNRIAPIFGRGPQRWQPDPARVLYNFPYGLPEFLSLCQQIGAQPWIVIPTAFYDNELTQLGNYLASEQAIYKFSEIIVEFGNENWNPIFRPASIPDPGRMAQAANRAFGLIRTAAGSAVPLHLVVNGQFVNPSYGWAVLNNTPQADAIDVAPYFFQTMNATDNQTTSLASMFNLSDESTYVPELQGYASPLKKNVDAYEVNLNTTSGTATGDQRNALVAGMVSGTALANRLIEGISLGLRRQMVWEMNCYNDSVSPTLGFVDLWGVERDLAAANDSRPTGLALQMLNTVIGGDFHKVTTSGPGSGNLTAAAFLNNGNWAVAIASSNAVPTTVQVLLPSGGTAPSIANELAASAITSDNETSTAVTISSIGLSPGPQVTVPAYGLVTLIP